MGTIGRSARGHRHAGRTRRTAARHRARVPCAARCWHHRPPTPVVRRSAVGVRSVRARVESGAAEPEPVIAQRSAADGTLVGSPVRGAQVLAAIREVNGWAFSVAEDDLLNARDRLARRGFYVEPTSAMTLAALPRVQQHLGGADGPIVLIATGNGLKAPS
ncbi:MAG: pyridoxal-phosphate dependent enzyme [Chloroflexi bacterium]|nr:pyridoxal-phosphate dependent enzyme [Chloroflexota bacterium]